MDKTVALTEIEKIIPKNYYLLILPLTIKDTDEHGLLLPAQPNQPCVGKIIALPQETTLDLKAGDIVLYRQPINPLEQLTVHNETYYFVFESEVLGIYQI